MRQNFISEYDVEKMAMEELSKQGYETFLSYKSTSANKEIDSLRNDDRTSPILVKVLEDSLKSINPGYDLNIYKEAVRQVVRLANSPKLISNNHYFHMLLINGIKVKISRMGEDRTVTLYPISFNDVSSNRFIATNQFTVCGRKERRPDSVIFINGLPVVNFEFKDAGNPNISIKDAYNQIMTYKKDISEYMQYNEIVIISDAILARAGSITSGFDRYMHWRNDKKTDNDELELITLIKRMLNPKDLLNIIHNFIIFEDDGYNTKKILAAYHQYYMVNKALKYAKKSIKRKTDKRIGVVWHTTGSGKSLSMVFFSGIAAQKLKNPTIIVINDRNDLDDQLYETFACANEFLRQNPQHVENSSELRNVLSKKSGGIIFSTIQKFSPNFEDGETHMPILSDRENIIVIADEAHRTQYGLTAKYGEDGIRYGFAKYLRDALPNASFMGFTGTPISKSDKSTTAVFGNYIDVYDITQAVEDNATVKIYYESQVFPLKIKDDSLIEYHDVIDKLDEQVNKNISKSRSNHVFSGLEALAGSKSRMANIAKNFVEHFEKRQSESFGKSMIVEMSRKNAVRLYNEIIKLRPEWENDEIDKGKIKIVMTSAASDGPELSKFQTSKSERRILQQRMKDNLDELKIVIVVDMWLTGFDVPSMNTMYIDKPMKGHNLIQAIARVNRVFKDKKSGLIVDYIGIAENLKQALNVYSINDQNQVGINISKAIVLLKEKYEIIKNDYLFGVDYSEYNSKNHFKRIDITNKVANRILSFDDESQKRFLDLVTEIQKLYSLTATQEEAQIYGEEISFFKTIKVFVNKLKSPGQYNYNEDVERDENNYVVQQMIDQSIISEPKVDIYNQLGIKKESIDLISDEFLGNISKMSEKNIAVTLLEKLLNGKIKAMHKTNTVVAKKFQEMLNEAIDEYNNRGITSEIIIRKLIEMAKQFNSERNKGKELGLSPEEIAFYDALADHDKAVKVLGEEKLQLIAKELVRTVREKSGVDFEKRKNIQAKMRIAVKRLLRKYGYPPDLREEAVDTVVGQAELMASNNNNE